jgi:hypothetical protein
VAVTEGVGQRFITWDNRIKLLCVLIEFNKKCDIVIARGAAYPQALLNDIIHNASLSSSECTVPKTLR